MTTEEQAEQMHNALMELCTDRWRAEGLALRPLPDTRGLLKEGLFAAIRAERKRMEESDIPEAVEAEQARCADILKRQIDFQSGLGDPRHSCEILELLVDRILDPPAPDPDA